MYNPQMQQGGQYQGQPPYGGPQQYNQPPYPQAGQPYAPPQQHQQAYGQQPQYAQQPPYQGAYQQAGPPYPQPQRNNSYPPAKRQKGNPVITKYAPPPGYQPPPPGQPYQAGNRGFQQGFQQQQPQAYPQPNGPRNYPQAQGWQAPSQQGYQPPQNYQQPQNYQAPQGYQAPQQNYPPQQAHQTYPPPQGYQQPPVQAYPVQYPPQQGFQQQGPPGPPNNYQPPQGSPDGYQQPPQQWHGSPQSQSAYPASDGSQYGGRQFNTPPRTESLNRSGRNSATPTHVMQPPPPNQGLQRSSSIMSMSSDPEQAKAGAASTNDPLNLAAYDWEYDGDGALWPKNTEPVDNNLSIGIIVWHPAVQMTRALPSTFEEAETYMKKAQPKPLGNGESVSRFFTGANSHAAYLSIRQTDHHKIIEDDPIFVYFTEQLDADWELVSMESALQSNARSEKDRLDHEQVQKEQAGEKMEDVQQDEEQGEVKEEQGSSIMDTLESALSASNGPSPNFAPKVEDEESTRPGPMKVFPVDNSQEDILAALGVTGAPKPVYPTPGPAYAPPDEELEFERPQPPQPVRVDGPAHPADRRSPQKEERRPSYHPPPPPPAPAEYEHYVEPERTMSPSYNVWRDDQRMPTNGHHSPARSDKSNHTIVGSDFGQDATEGATQTNGSGADSHGTLPASDDSHPPLLRNDSSGTSHNKRSFDHFNEQGNEAENKRQQDDGFANRKRRNTRTPSAAYSRR